MCVSKLREISTRLSQGRYLLSLEKSPAAHYKSPSQHDRMIRFGISDIGCAVLPLLYQLGMSVWLGRGRSGIIVRVTQRRFLGEMRQDAIPGG